MQTKSESNAAKISLLKLAEAVLQKRYEILINSVDKETLIQFQIGDIRKGFLENKNRLKFLSYDVIMFQVSLIINGTKCFEAFSFDKDGKRRFEETAQNLRSIIWKNSSSIINSLTYEVVMNPYKKQYVIDQATLNIRKNFLIVKLIAGPEFTRQMLEEFFSVQQYKVFNQPSYLGKQFIQVLSSFDGKIVYIHESLNDDYSNLQYEEPEQEVFMFTDQKYVYLIWLIEYVLMENLSRWSSKSHVLSISPEKNQNLRVEGQQMIGSGSFYLRKAHKYINKLTPFKLNYKIEYRCLRTIRPND